MKKISKLKKFWHDSRGKFIVPYFWATLFLSTFFVLIVLHAVMCVVNNWSVLPAIGILAGLVMGLIYLYNQGKNNISSDISEETTTNSIPDYEDPPPPPPENEGLTFLKIPPGLHSFAVFPSEAKIPRITEPGIYNILKPGVYIFECEQKMESPEEWPEYSIVCEKCYWYDEKKSHCRLSSDMMRDCVESEYKEHFRGG